MPTQLPGRLFVVRGCPEEVFPHLFHAWGTTRLTFEVDPEPSARQRDTAVAKLAAQHGVEVVREVSHTLYDTERWVPGPIPRGTRGSSTGIKHVPPSPTPESSR